MPLTTPDARTLATQILTQVIHHGHSLSDCLDTNSLPDPRDRALVQELCYGVLRWLPKLQALLQLLLKQPLKAKDGDIQVLLLIGLYQQLYLRIPPHAAIAATVNVTRAVQKNWATGLVNAILRNFQRQRDTLLTRVETDHCAQLAHPAWILTQLQTDWPTQWEAIVSANNEHPPFTLRVNSRCVSRDEYLQLLQNLDLVATPTPYTDVGITLAQPVEVQRLPNFHQGWISVQDGAAQLAASLLDVPTGARVLDACAAPGGKTAHLLERYTINKLVALDSRSTRVQKLQDTLRRLHLEENTTVFCADATQPDTWWDGQPFDRILLDVPCSGSGVIRRHPDIKHLRQPNDLATLVAQQTRLLETLWPLLAIGGKLLYVTCSVFAQENFLQIQRFLTTHANAHEIPLIYPWGHILSSGRQILPGEDDFDGFYYACLFKIHS